MRGVRPAQPEQRRLSQEDVARVDQRAHEAEQQGQQQHANVRAVDVGIGHQHDLVITQLVDVEVVIDAGAQRRDDCLDLLVRPDAVDARLLDVQDFASQRKDRLGPRVAAALSGATCRVALHDENFALFGVLRAAVRQLARQAARTEQTLAVTRQVAGLSGRDAGGRGGHRLADDFFTLGGVTFQPVAELVVDDALHETTGLGVA